MVPLQLRSPRADDEKTPASRHRAGPRGSHPKWTLIHWSGPAVYLTTSNRVTKDGGRKHPRRVCGEFTPQLPPFGGTGERRSLTLELLSTLDLPLISAPHLHYLPCPSTPCPSPTDRGPRQTRVSRGLPRTDLSHIPTEGLGLKVGPLLFSCKIIPLTRSGARPVNRKSCRHDLSGPNTRPQRPPPRNRGFVIYTPLKLGPPFSPRKPKNSS